MGWNYEHMNQLWKLDDYSESIYYVYKKNLKRNIRQLFSNVLRMFLCKIR